MKNRIPLSKSVALGNDLSTTAFKGNYIYLQEDGIAPYLEPSSIISPRLVYPGPGIVNTPGQIVMPQALENKWKSVLEDTFALIANRLENPL